MSDALLSTAHCKIYVHSFLPLLLSLLEFCNRLRQEVLLEKIKPHALELAVFYRKPTWRYNIEEHSHNSVTLQSEQKVISAYEWFRPRVERTLVASIGKYSMLSVVFFCGCVKTISVMIIHVRTKESWQVCFETSQAPSYRTGDDRRAAALSKIIDRWQSENLEFLFKQ